MMHTVGSSATASNAVQAAMVPGTSWSHRSLLASPSTAATYGSERWQKGIRRSAKPRRDGGLSVLVTGSGGFVGAHCSLALKARGDGMVGRDNFNSYYDQALKRGRQKLLADRGVVVLDADINYALLLERLFEAVPFTHALHPAAQELFAAVDGRPWKRLAKRRVQHYGYEFLYETRNVDSKQFLGELPSFVSKILDKIVTFPGVKNCTGKLVDQLTTHSAFEEMIFSLSLAGPCIMEFRQYPKGSWHAPSVASGTDECGIQDPQCIRKAVFLPPRSMLLISGEGRYAWHHYIPHHKIDDVAGQVIKRNSRRVSFTLRKVRMGLCECEYGQFCDSQSK